MLISSGKSLKGLTSLKVGGTSKYLSFITSESDLIEFHKFTREKEIPMVVVGELTNTFFKDGEFNAMVAIMAIKGIRIMEDFGNSTIIEVKAGENWDRVVAWAVSRDLSGIESMSGIPGSMGAAPVQNIGAYGSEISNVFIKARVYDTRDETFKELSLNECHFSYRNSVFKKKNNPYIIISVTMELKKAKPEIPKYKDVEDYFKKAKRRPNLKQIRNAILEIRSKKLPDPKTIPNCGSFFINPIIQRDVAEKLFKKFPKIPYFESDEGIKIYAGWLIENAGLKGKDFGNVSIYKSNALVLTTNGKASYKEVENAIEEIVDKVERTFGIKLVQEPQVLY